HQSVVLLACPDRNRRGRESSTGRGELNRLLLPVLVLSSHQLSFSPLMCSTNSSADSITISSSVAFDSLLPAASPAMRRSVLEDTEDWMVAPRDSSHSEASERVTPSGNLPVRTMFLPDHLVSSLTTSCSQSQGSTPLLSSMANRFLIRSTFPMTCWTRASPNPSSSMRLPWVTLLT